MPVGDYHEETFDKDELAALGEAEGTVAATTTETDTTAQDKDKGPDTLDDDKDKTDDTAKTEPTDEEKAALENKGARFEDGFIIDEDGEKIPLKRFREVYREAKEGERTKEKLDLFKRLGSEGYYQVYPDEKPEGHAPARETAPPDTDIGSLIVQQPDGTYDGMTLREVYDIDPIFANRLQTDYLWNQKQDAERQRGEAERLQREAATEIETFGNSIAKEMFGKEAAQLSKEEEPKIAETIQRVLDWMNKTHRGGGVIADGYFLMNKEGLLKKAAENAGKSTLRSLQDRKGPASIDTGHGGELKETGFEAYEKMTEDQLTDKIDAMPDKEMAKFFREAPKSLRAKHPKLPWD